MISGKHLREIACNSASHELSGLAETGERVSERCPSSAFLLSQTA